jgi:hypothetical protein
MPGVAITSPLPVVGSTASPTWATQLRAWCDEVEADLEAKIIPSEININADLEFNGYKLTEAKGARFDSQTTASTGVSNTNMLEVVAGDLYFVDGDGSSVRMTASGTLSLSTSGGIGGDYPTSAAEVTYSDTSTEYTFSDQNASTRPASLNCGDIRLRAKTNGSYAISLIAPAMAAAYSIIYPAAKGSGTQAITATTSGTNVTLGFSDSLSLAGSVIAATGMKFKNTGSGSDTLSHYEDQGSTSDVRAFDPTVEGVGAATLTYTKRYAYYQKIGGWVNAFVSIIFESSATVGTTADIKVRGLPWKAKGDAIGTITGNIAACGVCANFPPLGLAQSGFIATSSISVADYSTGSGAINVNTAVSLTQQVIPVMVDDNADVYFMLRGVMNSMTASENNEWDGATIPPTSSGTALTNALNVNLNSSGYHYITFSISYRAGAAV